MIVHVRYVKIYCSIFDKNPDWRDYYKDVHGDNVMSPEFRAAAARVGADYDILMDVLENDAEVDAQLQHMASKYKPPVTPEGFFPVSSNSRTVQRSSPASIVFTTSMCCRSWVRQSWARFRIVSVTASTGTRGTSARLISPNSSASSTNFLSIAESFS